MNSHSILCIRLCIVTAVIVFIVLIRPASAEMTEKDVMIAMRILTFLENPPKGTVDVGILSDPADTASVKDAMTAKTAIGQGLVVGEVTVRARILAPGEVQTSNSLAAILVTGGSPPVLQEVAAAARSRKLLTITTDPACVRAELCAVLVRSEPKIQVFFNSHVTRENGISFSQAFSMMVKEFQ